MNRGECEMKNKYVVAISFMILAIITLAIHASNSKVGANGFLEEPFFFLVPISYILFLSGIGVLLFGLITSKLNKSNR
ncbi:DUF3955 domain-containing protein [Bacillus cereus]|uniref:DUF3955 domain-containing protein n=1 Tax=Bacillus TaxID=1386 RepID=UPI000B44116B|nr:MULTISPECIES: DUF3955 domain-containing protein [Bacillus]MDA1905192.1 DUF3955 domain-containing protein [Bacillus cereus]MDA2166745.1 DUF3955 domain-containing protein [Bacillus cereus]MDQ7232200.1 DUF3955 domain-containing protein [Bacillus pacificus]MDQ7239056.1 DUF3955 domain-containing protein [Bacillus pacificus]OTX99034.1 hypothetical protein BK731_28420 [Bacillus thuringiensis serovar muju]